MRDILINIFLIGDMIGVAIAAIAFIALIVYYFILDE